jgi:hypothetical protein
VCYYQLVNYLKALSNLNGRENNKIDNVGDPLRDTQRVGFV